MNNFELIGRVNYINIKYTDSGKCYTRVLLSKRRGEDDYITFPVTFFNNKNGNVAEEISDAVEKGNYIRARGKLDISKFKAKDGTDVERIDLIGFEFALVEYDKEQGKYVEVTKTEVQNDRYGTVETSTTQAVIDDEEIPF